MQWICMTFVQLVNTRLLTRGFVQTHSDWIFKMEGVLNTPYSSFVAPGNSKYTYIYNSVLRQKRDRPKPTSFYDCDTYNDNRILNALSALSLLHNFNCITVILSNGLDFKEINSFSTSFRCSSRVVLILWSTWLTSLSTPTKDDKRIPSNALIKSARSRKHLKLNWIIVVGFLIDNHHCHIIKEGSNVRIKVEFYWSFRVRFNHREDSRKDVTFSIA